MITALIFFAHLFFALILFTKFWQIESVTSALMNVGLFGLLFAVGWSIAGLIPRYIIPQEGLGIYYDRDAINLTLLTIAEFMFYKMYYKNTFFTEAETGK